MVRYILTVVLCCTVFIACNRKPEVIKSNVRSNLYFIKNTNNDNIAEVKSMVKAIVDSTPKKDTMVIRFYKYTSDFGPFFRGTSYFIDNVGDPGGFSSELLEYYEEEEIAIYLIIPEKNGVFKTLSFSNEYR
jgi:hypothetical protein